jgi:lipid II:glycine glycyltransferase (peptidoglycan interpeptide bridge formation enzyme)
MHSRAITAAQLDQFVSHWHPEANLLQSSHWGEAATKRGLKVVREGIYDGDQLIGAYQAIVRPARRARYLEVPGGPLLDWSNQPVVDAVIASLKSIATKHGCVFARLRPQVLEPEAADITKQPSFRPSPFHLAAEHTNIIDLTPDEDTLLMNMRQQNRQLVRKALADPELQVSYRTDRGAFALFHEVQVRTAARQNFFAPSERELFALHEAFGDHARIYATEYQGRPISLGLVIISGREADYLEAASELEARKIPGAYALQWQVIRDMRALGIARYNLWGIASDHNPNHRYANVTTFKNGFGGTPTTYVHAQDIVIRPARYTANYLIESVRKKLRHV